MSAKRLLCSHIEKNDKGVESACHRYLGNTSETTLFIRCPKCGNFTPIEFNSSNEEDRMKEIRKALQTLSTKGQHNGNN